MTTSFARPRRLDRRLDSLWVQLPLSAVAGLIVAGIALQSTKKFSFWTLTVASAAAFFFISNFILLRLLTPRVRPDAIRGESQSLTDSIMWSLKSTYAVSSNWLDLWRAPSFAYYLHLDATTSLVSYCERYDSPLARLSADRTHQIEFHKEGLDLVRAIASGDAPVAPHRLRLLIYPRWVYEDYEAAVSQLIRSHSAGRIPCLPLIAEELYRRMAPDERSSLAELTNKLEQDILDKMPPRAPIVQNMLRLILKSDRFRPRLGPVFPDVLLVDADLPSDSARAWWYNRNGSIFNWNRHNNELTDVNDVLRIICCHASVSCWPEYTAAMLGPVAVTPPRKRLESEAFFGRDYYQRWLKWIANDDDEAARQLAEWLDAETDILDSFAATLSPSHGDFIRLLDLGCGYGRHLLHLTQNHKIDGVGLDINERMITGALEAVHKRDDEGAPHEGRVSLVVGDVALMGGIKPDSFDAAICMTNTIGNMPPIKQKATLQRLATVLRPGGRALLSVYGENSTQARIKSYGAVGLRVEEQEELHRIVAAQGLSSECFGRKSLEHLIGDNGLRVESITPIGGIGYAAVATPTRPGEE